jgi:hypothetical protein
VRRKRQSATVGLRKVDGRISDSADGCGRRCFQTIFESLAVRPDPGLLFGCGLFYICIFIFLGAAGPGIMQVLPLGALPLIVILTSTPHYGATLLRVYEHRENRRKYAFFAVGITALLGGAFVFSLFKYLLGSILVTLYFNWNSWHYAGQNYGLAVMFLRRRGVGVEPLAKKLLYASFILSSALAIVSINFDATSAIYGPNATAGATNLFGPLYHFISLRLPAQITTPLLAVGLTAYLGCLVAAFTMLGRKGSLSDLLPALILVET